MLIEKIKLDLLRNKFFISPLGKRFLNYKVLLNCSSEVFLIIKEIKNNKKLKREELEWQWI